MAKIIMAPQLRTSWVVLALLVLVTAASDAAAAELNRWLPIGPQAGTVRALDVSRRGTVYAGMAHDGVYHSVDGGALWTPARGGSSLAGALEVVADPGDPRALYALLEDGLYYRRPNGQWIARGPGGRLDAFAVAPSEPRRLYAAGGSSSWVSHDRGLTWEPSCCGSPSGAAVMRVHPHDADVVYAATEGGILKSADGGQSWSLLAADIAAAPIVVHALVLDPRNPEVLYAGTADDGIWRSRDGGATWAHVRPTTGKGETVAALAIDPSDSRRVYAGTVRVFATGPPSGQVWRSRSGGAGWEKVLDPGAVLALAVGPVGGEVFAGVEHGGVRVSRDGGATWRNASRGLQAQPVFDVEVDPHRAGALWVASPEQSAYEGTYPGLLVSVNEGKSWNRRDPKTGFDRVQLAQVVLDPRREGRVWALGLREVYRSLDGGASWEKVDFVRFASELAIDPERPDRLYVAGSRRVLVGDGAIDIPVLWRSADGGDSWAQVEQFDVPQPSEQGRGLFGLAVHPARTDTVFALGTTGVFRSRNAGLRWIRLSGVPSGCVGPAAVIGGALVVDPFRVRTLYLTHCDPSNPVLKSTDGGVSWRPTSLRMASAVTFVWTLVADPHHPGTLYAGGDEGVFVSDDRGTTWQPLSDGLPPDRRVYTLTVDPHVPDRIYAGSATGGLFGLTRSR